MTAPTQQDEWRTCPAGKLSGLAGRIRARRSRQATMLVAGKAAAAVGILLLVVSGVRMLKGTGGADMRNGGISCTEVRRLAPEYMAGRTDDDVAARIRMHLGQCPLCQTFLEEMRRQSVESARRSSVLRADRRDGVPDRSLPESVESLLAARR